MLKCVESPWYQEGLTEPNLCHWWCGVSSCSVDFMQVIWLTHCLLVQGKNISTYRSLEVPLLHTLCLPLFPLCWNSPHSKRITWKIASQCPLLVSFPSLLRKLWRTIWIHTNSPSKPYNYQSAYRKCHSNETTLLKIHSGILSSIDDGKVKALTLLDQSAAFDTIDHGIFLRKLRLFQGYWKGTWLVWIVSDWQMPEP